MLVELHLTATDCHLSYRITQCYLPRCHSTQVNTSRLNPNQYTWVHVDPRHTFCEIFHDLFVIFLPNFMYSSPIHMSSWRLNITYLGLAQKPAHTILHWGPRGPQTNQFWKAMQAWVWLLTYLSLLLLG